MAKAAAAAAPGATAPKAKVETVSTKQLGNQLAEKHELSNKAANAILEDTIALISKHLKKGAKIRLNGLGIFQVRKRAARMGRNPATGEAIKIKASKKVGFRVAKELKESI
jgi:DNA-binding protein HU-beta